MKHNSSSVVFFFFFLLLSHLTLHLKVNADSSTIDKVCGHAPHKELCETGLEADPNSSHLDTTGLALIALKLASANATDTSDHIAKLLNNSTLDPFIEQCLTDCSEQYLDAIDQIEDSLAALTAKAYIDVITWLSAGIADIATCESGFTEKPGYESMLTHRNHIFKQLCENALSIVELLQK